MEFKRIDGKPDCFGQPNISKENSIHCKTCGCLGECVDALIGIDPNQRTGLEADVRRGDRVYANNS